TPPDFTRFPYTTLFRSGGDAAEVGRVDLLPGLDDRAAHGPGAGEQVEQLVAVAPADGALQRRQVFREPGQHLQDGVLVVQAHVRSEEHTSELQSRENLV